MTPVRIEQSLLHRICIREQGLPSLHAPGQIWRSEEKSTISCMVAGGVNRVSVETLPLVILTDSFEMSWMPDHWRAALWNFCQCWPGSGMGYGPFLCLTEEERCHFIRAQAKRLVDSDDLGCRSMAHNIGLFSAYNFQVAEPSELKSNRIG